MEINFEDRLIRKDIKKIKRKYTDNIFSSKLNSNIVKIIMKYLDTKYLYEYAKSSIFIFNIFIDYENETLYDSLKEKIKKKICKLLLTDDKECYGLFINISQSLKALLININLKNTSILGQTNKIKLISNNNEQEIDLNNRVIYSFENSNISLIEILPEIDNFDNYFEYEDYYDLSRLTFNESICIYNNKLNIHNNIIYGILKQKEDNCRGFCYLCQNNNIEKSSPILNLLNNKIIGIHEKANNTELNIGYYINNFIEKFQKEKIFSVNNNANTAAILRLLKELKKCNKNKYIIIPRDSFFIWDAIIFGPENTPYQNGKFKIEIRIPRDYPFKEPSFYFITKIYHPSFKGERTKICCCSISDLEPGTYTPAKTIIRILDKIHSLLETPEPDTEIKCASTNRECAVLMLNNREKYKEIALQWTKDYAL